MVAKKDNGRSSPSQYLVKARTHRTCRLSATVTSCLPVDEWQIMASSRIMVMATGIAGRLQTQFQLIVVVSTNIPAHWDRKFSANDHNLEGIELENKKEKSNQKKTQMFRRNGEEVVTQLSQQIF